MLSDIAMQLPDAISPERLGRLARSVLEELDLPITTAHVHLFGQVYRHFLSVVPAHQRDGKRLVDLYRASIGLPPPRPATTIDTERLRRLEEAVQRYRQQETIYAEREEAWATKAQRLRLDLKHANEVVTNLYNEMKKELDADRERLQRKEEMLRHRESALEDRLTALQEAERRLLPEVEARVRRELGALLKLEVEEVRNEMEAVRTELADVLQQIEKEGNTESPTPLVAAVRKLKQEATAAGIDPLTGLATRALFERDLAQAQATFQQTFLAIEPSDESMVFALLSLDLDGFQPINRHHGRAIGDDLLREVARTLATHLQETDRAYRQGGDELVVHLPGTDTADAQEVAETIRAAIEGLRVTTPSGDRVGVSVSIGVAGAAHCGPAVLHCTDLALSRAKEAGGNRTCEYRDEAFVAPPPTGLTAGFHDEIRTRLQRGERLTVAALHTPTADDAADTMAKLHKEVHEIFPGSITETVGEDLFVLLPETTAEAAAATIGSRIDIAMTAGATDQDEITQPDLASPGARATELINTSLAIALEQQAE
jgi:diguanylate cyclase (GGDEF)-like protein